MVCFVQINNILSVLLNIIESYPEYALLYVVASQCHHKRI